MLPRIHAIPRQRLPSRRLLVIVALVSLLLATLGEQVFTRVVRPDALRIVITEYQLYFYAEVPPVVTYEVTTHSEAIATRVRDLLTELPQQVYYGDALCSASIHSYSYDFTLSRSGMIVETSRLSQASNGCLTWTVSVGGLPDLQPHSHTLASYSDALHAITQLTHAPYVYQD